MAHSYHLAFVYPKHPHANGLPAIKASTSHHISPCVPISGFNNTTVREVFSAIIGRHFVDLRQPHYPPLVEHSAKSPQLNNQANLAIPKSPVTIFPAVLHS